MSWEIEYTDEFAEWWEVLADHDQDAIATAVDKLQEMGPSLGRPWVDTIAGSRHANMKELRPRGANIRIFFAFDPRRTGILLIGGDKTGEWNAWYRRAVPLADDLYDEHLNTLRREGELR